VQDSIAVRWHALGVVYATGDSTSYLAQKAAVSHGRTGERASEAMGGMKRGARV
jgi:hypothetical protein